MKTPVDLCIKRWNSLRERYSREVRQYTPSGSGNDARTTWHLFGAMCFLQPYIKPRRSKCSSNILASDSAEVTSPDFIVESDFVVPTSPAPCTDVYESSAGMHFTSSSEDCEASTSSNKRKRKESSVDKAILEARSDFKKVCKNQPQTKNLAVESFGRMITATVDEMSAAKQTKAMRELTALAMAIKEEPEN